MTTYTAQVGIYLVCADGTERIVEAGEKVTSKELGRKQSWLVEQKHLIAEGEVKSDADESR